MSSRLALRRFISRALSSLMAQTLLKLDSDPLWHSLFQGQDLTLEQIERLRRQVREDLERVEGRGRRERDALVRGMEAVVGKVFTKGEPS